VSGVSPLSLSARPPPGKAPRTSRLKQCLSSSVALPLTTVPDFLSAMQQSKNADAGRELLKVQAALGFDTAQIVHSVLSDTRDSEGAL